MKTILAVLLVALVTAQAVPKNFHELRRSSALKSLPNSEIDHKPRKGGSRIIGGSTAYHGQFPHQAAVYIDGSSFCGGSLISTSVVLTAGHCAYEANSWEIHLGAQDLDTLAEGEVIIVTRTATVHEEYDEDLIRNDIALIFLGTTVTTSEFINTVGLPSSADADNSFAGQTVTASGWGKTSDLSPTINDELLYTALTVITNDECETSYPGYIFPSTLCCVGANAESTCNGDSGGAVVTGAVGSYTQVGIVSFRSARGCESGVPTGYTRVTFYLDWISQNAGINIP